MQYYTELVKNISADDLKTYAKQGLQLWCKNTSNHYDENTRSITNANTWNENYGLLVKIRWAVWLLLIKDELVPPENLKKNVILRRFDKLTSDDVDGGQAWFEYKTGGGLLPRLTKPKELCTFLSPSKGPLLGNVTYTICSLTEDLPEENTPSKYKELRDEMEQIATDTLNDCMTNIPLE